MNKRLETRAEFDQFVNDVESHPLYKRPRAFAIGIANYDSHNNCLDAYFPLINFETNYGSAAVISSECGRTNGTCSQVLLESTIRNILLRFDSFENDGKVHSNIELLKKLKEFSQRSERQRVVAVFIGAEDDDVGPMDVPDIYLRLHLLSHRYVLPNTIGVSPGAIMPKLPNVVWTSEGPMSPADVAERQLASRLEGNPLRVYGVDKLPHMLDYVVPSGVRIADSARVRLGAYVGDGTTVMQAGFINFNAGTKGQAMIEGRVPQGGVIGHGSDLGGGASLQGTMSGGSNVRVSVGDRSLVGALGGIGIPIGDDCIVAAGVYVMPTTNVCLMDENRQTVRWCKAHELSGQDGLLFVHGPTGVIEVRPNKKAVELNPLLHKN